MPNPARPLMESRLDSVLGYGVYPEFMLKHLTIGRLAKQAGVGVETIRFYEREGIIQRPPRRPSGAFRVYALDDALKIRFVKRAQNLGFTLKEVKQLLALNAGARATCAEVKRRADTKLAEISAKIADLKKMKRSLQALSEACGEGPVAVADCRKVADCFETPGCP